MGSEVYFSQRRATQGCGLLDKLEQLCEAAGLSTIVPNGGQVALLTTFAEPGNTTYVRPAFAHRVAGCVAGQGGRPFLTDTMPWPPTARVNEATVLLAAAAHGFVALDGELSLQVADAPSSSEGLPLSPGHGSPALIAPRIAGAEGLLLLTHVTCHAAWGVVGALTQLGFGAASMRGKAEILGNFEASEVAFRDDEERQARVQRLLKSAAAVVSQKQGRIGYINLLLDVTPDDDNRPWSDAPIVPDIGILVSRDPVAIDQATADLLQQAPGIAGTRLIDPLVRDKLRAVHPGIDWEAPLRLGEEFVLGHRDYELMIV
ncbi:MAG: DUF362 domain-containing protein [Candidatus Sericytochromatia bacterium]|nr:DUF362 domain-containing protein [Candidatus Sericytochromatia bacterium]